MKQKIILSIDSYKFHISLIPKIVDMNISSKQYRSFIYAPQIFFVQSERNSDKNYIHLMLVKQSVKRRSLALYTQPSFISGAHWVILFHISSIMLASSEYTHIHKPCNHALFKCGSVSIRFFKQQFPIIYHSKGSY